MQITQRVFQHSHYSHEVNNGQEWSQGEDHDDHQQPFQKRRTMAPLILLLEH